MMKPLISFPLLVLSLAGMSLPLPLLAQTPTIPVESVESPDVPTGSSEDIQGIEKDYNNWNWGVGGSYPLENNDSPYILAPESRSPDELTDEFQWENIGEPENSGAKVPLGNF